MNVVGPLRGGVKVVERLQLISGKVVESPHSFFSPSLSADGKSKKKNKIENFQGSSSGRVIKADDDFDKGVRFSCVIVNLVFRIQCVWKRVRVELLCKVLMMHPVKVYQEGVFVNQRECL